MTTMQTPPIHHVARVVDSMVLPRACASKAKAHAFTNPPPYQNRWYRTTEARPGPLRLLVTSALDVPPHPVDAFIVTTGSASTMPRPLAQPSGKNAHQWVALPDAFARDFEPNSPEDTYTVRHRRNASNLTTRPAPSEMILLSI